MATGTYSLNITCEEHLHIRVLPGFLELTTGQSNFGSDFVRRDFLTVPFILEPSQELSGMCPLSLIGSGGCRRTSVRFGDFTNLPDFAA